MNTLRIRDADAGDLATIAHWLAPAPAPVLPAVAFERLLVAERLTGPGDALADSRLLATLRLRPAVGLDLPRAWYHVGCTVHAARDLALFHRQRTLLLGNDHTGASELADLASASEEAPIAEQAQALRLLLQTALLLMARRRASYAGTLIAELPGLRDNAGQSPFWHGLGRHFYSGDPAAAEAKHGAAWRSHLAALLPRQPVYTSFLPVAAQAAIAQVPPAARLQRELLEEAGLRYSRHVTLFDGGPVLEADLDALPAVTASRVWTVADAAADDPAAAPWLLAHDSADGRLIALRASAVASGSTLGLSDGVRAQLGVAVGQPLWALPLRPVS